MRIHILSVSLKIHIHTHILLLFIHLLHKTIELATFKDFLQNTSDDRTSISSISHFYIQPLVKSFLLVCLAVRRDLGSAGANTVSAIADRYHPMCTKNPQVSQRRARCELAAAIRRIQFVLFYPCLIFCE